jgi:Flp pilus assembly pilin Flp
MKNHYLRSEEAATATEYLILVVFIALALFVGATFLGGVLNNELSDAGQTIEDGAS